MKLPVQLELGIPAELVPLALHANGNLNRPDLLRLHSRGLADAAAIVAADDDTLKECVGGSPGRDEGLGVGVPVLDVVADPKVYSFHFTKSSGSSRRR
jgi:hypothetical protein